MSSSNPYNFCPIIYLVLLVKKSNGLQKKNTVPTQLFRNILNLFEIRLYKSTVTRKKHGTYLFGLWQAERQSGPASPRKTGLLNLTSNQVFCGGW